MPGRAARSMACPHHPSRLRPEALAEGRVGHDLRVALARLFSRIGWMVQPMQRKENIMRTNTQCDRPMFRVSFSRITGKDGDGNDVLSRPREIGAVWPRKNGKAGGLLVLDLIPVELTQRQGVLFLVPVQDSGKAGGQ